MSVKGTIRQNLCHIQPAVASLQAAIGVVGEEDVCGAHVFFLFTLGLFTLESWLRLVHFLILSQPLETCLRPPIHSPILAPLHAAGAGAR